MNISLKNNDDAISGVLKLEVVKADYADQVEKSLRSFRQKANISGFRKGMAPMGMIKKMYGKSVLGEEVNKLVSENVFKYIRENDLNILGEPLLNKTEQGEIDFDNREDFDFYFDIAFAPTFNIDLNKRDKLPYYQITIDDDTLEKQIDSYRESYGTYDDTAEIAEEKDLIKGLVTELENGLPKENGMVVEEAILMPMYIKDEEEKKKFIGADKNSVITFNPSKAYEGAEAEIASFLKVDKSTVGDIANDFTFEINEITHHQKAEMNQELFDKVFGEGKVATEEEFRNKVKESIGERFAPQSDYKFLLDIRKLLLKKAGDVNFADDILKRWLMASSEKRTEEQLEEEYPQIIEDLKYHLIKEDLVKKNNIKVEDEDIQSLGRRVAQSQIAQYYGMLSIPEDVLDNYAKEMLKNEQTLQNVVNRAIDDKLAAWLKDKVKLDVKEVSFDDFNKLIDDEKQ
ncbi:MAG: trigger factor [Tannerellaceae bacterium]|jgi:trigger factor|nr:trigger factor [Tannerellaceae bacterium]